MLTSLTGVAAPRRVSLNQERGYMHGWLHIRRQLTGSQLRKVAMDPLPVSCWTVLLLAGALSAVIYIGYQSSLSRRGTRSLPLPPGPPGWPLVGNLFDIPMECPWLAYRDLGRRYSNGGWTSTVGVERFSNTASFGNRAGKFVYLNVGVQSLLVVNDFGSAVKLLEKRAAIYSSRPHLNMANL